MAKPTYEEAVLPARKAVVVTYSGPRSGVGRAVQPVAEWASLQAPDRVEQITIAFAERPADPTPPAAPIEARVTLDLPEDLDAPTLPEGLTFESLPSQHVLRDVYAGPLTGLVPVMITWLAFVADERNLAPGYRQRILRRGSSPSDSAWRIEMSVVLA